MKGLWDLAMVALRNASAIVFVGYRFPPTDAHARETLLGAIHSNPLKTLCVHTVLGPDSGSPDARRLRRLLEYALEHERCAGRALITEPLFTEDFFTVFDAGHHLHPPAAYPIRHSHRIS